MSLDDLELLPLCITGSVDPRLQGPGSRNVTANRGPRVWADSIESVVSLVATGHYAGIAAFWPAAYGKWEELVEVRPLAGQLPYRVAVCFQRVPPPSPTVTAFVRCALDFFKGVAGEFTPKA